MSTPEETPVDTPSATPVDTPSATPGEAAAEAPAPDPAPEPESSPSPSPSPSPIPPVEETSADAEVPLPALVDSMNDETSKAAQSKAEDTKTESPAAPTTADEDDAPKDVDVEAAPTGEEDAGATPDAEGSSTEEDAGSKAESKAAGEEDAAAAAAAAEGEEEPKKKTFFEKLSAFYWKNEFLALILLAILVAKAYPPLGAIHLVPKITSTWIAVMFIFLLAGLGLKTEEFTKAFQRCYFNSFVQVFNFGVDSAIVFGFSRLLLHYNVIIEGLADGMVITSCLPLTINMCIVLTVASGGDEGSAIINCAFGNLFGVLVSPILIMGYIGAKGNVAFMKVFTKLAIRVLLPIAIGQGLKWGVPVVNDFVKKYKPYFKKLQMYSLVYIVYTVFCKTFIAEDQNIPIRDVFLMILFIFLLLIFLMVLAWYSLRVFFFNEYKLRVMGLYACTHKTVAMGIPLINAIYEGDPNIALYTLPLLIWHPMQLIVGTFLSPRLAAWVEDNVPPEEEGEEEKEIEEEGVVKVLEVGANGADPKEVDVEQGSAEEEEAAKEDGEAEAPSTVEQASPDGDDIFEDDAANADYDAIATGKSVEVEI
eukprot:CAMPEP_0172408862 /NCGR_PEP_ID=MMETSP1061-20121228/76070_1 /TAXON_ID=37318 /ORGANISM="Pseudo-nitzschia pungens, Strain cf. pungens" /LENGTH=591 /DNA_ID=CAMNT_0013145005 /DNA_START=560 /DNA_END=2335 /DNA_ORIENTATION=-